MTYADPTDDLDIILSVLSNRRRRIILRAIADQGTISLRALSNIIMDIEDDGNGAQRKSVYTTLYQTHAIKLEQAHVCCYDEREKELSRGPKFERCYSLLRCVDSC